jgi:hypothetical protein
MNIANELYKIAAAQDAAKMMGNPIADRVRAALFGSLGGAAVGGASGGLFGLAYEATNNNDEKDYTGAVARGMLGGAIGGGVAGGVKGLFNKGKMTIPGERSTIIYPDGHTPRTVHAEKPGTQHSLHGDNALAGLLPGSALGLQFSAKKPPKKEVSNQGTL